MSQSNAITAAIAFMKLELHRPLSVRELAEAVKMSESRFAHVWKRDGHGPAAVPQTAAHGARTLLLSGSTVSEAAARVGYASLSRFIRVFNRHVGVPPRVYSKRL